MATPIIHSTSSSMKKFFIAFLFGTALIISFLFVVTPELVLAQSNNTNTSGQTNSSSSGSDSGREASIGKYLCTPGQSGGIVGCIKQGYSFVLAIAIAAAVLLLVVAGYLYITGTEQSVQQAKSIISTTIAGIAILLLTYVILRQINPDLIELRGLEPLNINSPANTNSSNTTGGNQGSSGGDNHPENACKPDLSNCPRIDGGSSDVKCGNSNPAKCNAQPALVSILAKAQAELNPKGIQIINSSNVPQQAGHNDPCHGYGSCTDIQISPNKAESIAAACTALKNAGGLPYNEYEQYKDNQQVTNACGPYHKTAKATGDHIHVNIP